MPRLGVIHTNRSRARALSGATSGSPQPAQTAPGGATTAARRAVAHSNPGQTGASSGATNGPLRPARAAPSGATTAARRGLAGAIAVAKHIYGNEVNGGRGRSDLGFVLSDRALLSDLSRGRLSAAQQEAHRRMTGNRGLHITRVTVEREGSMIVNAVWNGNGSFVVGPVKRALHVRGRSLDTVLVSVQDVVGYVKLVHVFTGAQVVVRGTSGQVRASLAAAAETPLPSAGYVTIAGKRYIVGSFNLQGWASESLTVWVLEPA